MQQQAVSAGAVSIIRARLMTRESIVGINTYRDGTSPCWTGRRVRRSLSDERRKCCPIQPEEVPSSLESSFFPKRVNRDLCCSARCMFRSAKRFTTSLVTSSIAS